MRVARYLAASTAVHAYRTNTASCASPPRRTMDIPTEMNAARVNTFGDPSKVVVMERVPVPSPSPKQVLVKVRAASINMGDVFMCRGDLALMFKTPYTPGLDFCGEVVAVGDQCTHSAVGDVVFGSGEPPNMGSFAEFFAVEEAQTAPKPTNVTDCQAAVIPQVATTAYKAVISQGKVQPGEKVLIIGATGGIGSTAVQLVKSIGGTVTGVCSSRNVDYLTKLGADGVVDYTQKRWQEELVGGEFDVVIDIAGGRSHWDDSRAVLRRGGRFVSVSGPFDMDEPRQMTVSGIIRMMSSVAWKKLRSWFGAPAYVMVMATVETGLLLELKTMVEENKLTMELDSVFKLDEQGVRDMFVRCAEQHTRGKLCLMVSDDGKDQDQ